MNRGLVSFVAFCALLMGIAAAMVMWVGLDFALFAIDGDRRAAKVTVLSLDRLRVGQDAQAYRERFLVATDRLFIEREGEVLWRGTTRLVAVGTVRDEWDYVSLVTVPTGSAYIDVVTGADYRALAANVERLRAQSVRYIVENAPAATAPGELAVFLVRVGDGDASAVDFLTSASARYGGVRVWETDLAPLLVGDEEPWERMVGYRFPTASGLSDWLGDAERQTDTALALARLADFRLLVLESI